MINEVYTTVLQILNKDSRGYVTPQEFNNYAELAQLSIFEDLFHEYSKALVKQNGRLYHSEYSNIPAHIREVIDIFTSETTLVNNSGVYTIQDPEFYRLIQILANNREVEEVSKTEISRLIRNELARPTRDFPYFVKLGSQYKLYPTSLGNNVVAFYVRKPKAPKWTFFSVGGNALFNPSATDFQDFELPYAYYNPIIVKILMYCGVQIREAEILQLTTANEQMEQNKQQL
jgi:hypothetical protein